MIRSDEVGMVIMAIVGVGILFHAYVTSRPGGGSGNWFKYPIVSILFNRTPFVLYIRLLGITVCKIGKPDYYNEWNTLVFSFYGNFFLTVKWFIFGHQYNRIVLVKTELKKIWIDFIYGQKKVIYKRANGPKAFLVHIKGYSAHGDYFVLGTRTIKQRFKKTVTQYGYLLIGECELYSGKAFIEAMNREELTAKMTEAYVNIFKLQQTASNLNAMIAKATANMKQQAYEGRTIDM